MLWVHGHHLNNGLITTFNPHYKWSIPENLVCAIHLNMYCTTYIMQPKQPFPLSSMITGKKMIYVCSLKRKCWSKWYCKLQYILHKRKNRDQQHSLTTKPTGKAAIAPQIDAIGTVQSKRMYIDVDRCMQKCFRSHQCHNSAKAHNYKLASCISS